MSVAPEPACPVLVYQSANRFRNEWQRKPWNSIVTPAGGDSQAVCRGTRGAGRTGYAGVARAGGRGISETLRQGGVIVFPMPAWRTAAIRSRQRCMPAWIRAPIAAGHQRAARLHRRDAGCTCAWRPARRHRISATGHPGHGASTAGGRVAQRPRAHEFPPLLAGRDQAARHQKRPRVIERYPYLAGGKPWEPRAMKRWRSWPRMR